MAKNYVFFVVPRMVGYSLGKNADFEKAICNLDFAARQLRYCQMSDRRKRNPAIPQLAMSHSLCACWDRKKYKQARRAASGSPALQVSWFIFPRPSAWARQTVARWAELEWIAQHQNLQASGRHIVLLAGRRIHSLARRACMAEKRSEGFVIYLAVSDSERTGANAQTANGARGLFRSGERKKSRMSSHV